MSLVKFTPDRQPRHGDQNAAMTVWQVLLLLIDWVNTNYLSNFKSGLATVTAGNTTVTITHGLGAAMYRISLTPNGADPTVRYWVSNKIASSFDINLSAAAPGGGVSFDWIVKGE